MSDVSSKMVLGVGVAILAGMAYMTISQVSRNVAETGRGFALPELREHLSEVRSLTVTAAGEKDVLNLQRDTGGWTVAQRGSYPADSASINGLLRKLADARLLEAKTSVEQRYAELGVEDVKNPQAKGIKLILTGLSTPVRLIIGNATAAGTFVRRAEDRKAWLAKGNLQINLDPAFWLDHNLLDVAPERVAAVTVDRAGVKPLRLSRSNPEDAAFRLSERSRSGTLEGGVLGALPTALAGLTLIDVAPATQAPAAADTLRYETFDGLNLAVQAWSQEGLCHARLSAAFNPKEATTFIKLAQNQTQKAFQATGKPPAEAPLAVTDADKDLQQRLQEGEGSAAKLQRLFSEREFILPESSCARFVPPEELMALSDETAKPGAVKAAKGKRR